jgi:hypothetical protein
MDLEKLRAKMKAKAGPAPEPEGDEPPSDEAPADDGMKQKLIDAVTAAIESCFAT